MMLEEYKGNYYIINDLENVNNPYLQRMEDKKEESKFSNNDNKIFCCYMHKKNNTITKIEMGIIHKKILSRTKEIDNSFKNNKQLFTGIKYNEKYVIPYKGLNPFDNDFKNNKSLFISTNPFDDTF